MIELLDQWTVWHLLAGFALFIVATKVIEKKHRVKFLLALIILWELFQQAILVEVIPDYIAGTLTDSLIDIVFGIVGVLIAKRWIGE